MNGEYNGYAGRIAWIDLQGRTIKIKPTSDMFALIGGRGITSAILLDNPEALVIAPGALTGTFAPTATRTSVAARNQITGGIVYSSIGGHFGPEMKFAGFDGLVITGRVSGFCCPLACTHYYSAAREGEKINAEGMHANSVRGFGSNWDITDPLIVLKIHSICSEYGLNVDGVSAAVAWAMECFEEGLLTEKDTGGIKLCFGDGESALQVVEQIAAGVGFGALLEKGVAEAARITGRGTEKHAVTIKGTGINEQGLHTHLAWALGIAVSTRGGGHLGGSPQTENRMIPREVGQRLFGVADAGVPDSWQGKGKLVAWYEGYKSLVDMLGLCYFSYGWYNIDMADPDDLAELYYYASGLDCDGDELLQAGRRNHLREKYFNMIHTDFSRKDDTLPERVMKIPVSGGEYKGRLIKREYLEKMLDEYYLSLGWDLATGLPGKELLTSEGIIE